MISEAELRRTAGSWGADPMVVDLDYVLGCFLSQWYRDGATETMRFKGGTCLRKCYYPDYRFSEDLDFTAEKTMGLDHIEDMVRIAVEGVRQVFGVDLDVRPARTKTLRGNGGEAYHQVRLYYRGPLRRTGEPRAIRLDITYEESLALPPVPRPINHPYSDRELIAQRTVPCYDLREILAEKLRAVCGQRRFAISRDLYDLHMLVELGAATLETVGPIVGPKFDAKGLSIKALNPEELSSRKSEFQRDWSQNLLHLLPSGDQTAFADAWDTAVDAVSWVASLS